MLILFGFMENKPKYNLSWLLIKAYISPDTNMMHAE